MEWLISLLVFLALVLLLGSLLESIFKSFCFGPIKANYGEGLYWLIIIVLASIFVLALFGLVAKIIG